MKGFVLIIYVNIVIFVNKKIQGRKTQYTKINNKRRGRFDVFKAGVCEPLAFC